MASGNSTASVGRERLSVAVAIATAGRRDILTQTVAFLNNQIRKPDEFLICPAGSSDIDLAAMSLYDGQDLGKLGARSLPQAGALIAASSADIIVFLDDDLPAANYLAEVEELFLGVPDVTVATGHVVKDGAQGAGLELYEGLQALSADDFRGPDTIEPTFNGYGCNMAIRMAPVRAHDIRFDGDLPLYAWLEDLDFSGNGTGPTAPS